MSSEEEKQELQQQSTTREETTEVPSSDENNDHHNHINNNNQNDNQEGTSSVLNNATTTNGHEKLDEKQQEDQISDKDNNNEKTQPTVEEENLTDKDHDDEQLSSTSTVGETSPVDHEDENSETSLTNKTDQQEGEHLHEENEEPQVVEKPDLTPNPEDLLTLENGFMEKYKKISDVYKERLSRSGYANVQELLDLIDCEIKMLDFIRDHYATEFDEYNITNFKSANAIWYLQTHMVSILNHTTSLSTIEDNDLLSKIGDLINAAVRDYIYIKISYPFDLFQKIMESQEEQKAEKPTEKSSDSLELEESKSSPQLSEKEKQSQIVQKTNLISKSLVLGVDVCRSLTFQKHEIYSKNLVFARDNKMATSEYNYYMDLMQKHPQSTWNEDFANCIVCTPKPKGENILSKLCCKSINIFAQNGGYYLFNELLKKYKDLPIRVIEKIIDTISYQLAFLDQKTKETFVPEIINSMFIYIDTLSDQMLKIEEKFKDTLLFFRTKILSLYYNDEKSLEFYDRLKLQYFYRLLHCHSVERKMLGMNEIRSHVDTLIKADQMSKQGGSSPQLNGSNDSNLSSVNISKKDLHIRIFIAWSSEKKLLGYLFETDVHRELVRQSLSILKLLAQHKGFTREELDLLWNASVDKHEATERLILSTLAGFVPLLSLNDILYLYSKIEAIPVEIISKRDHMVDFLSHFTICAVNSFSKLKEKKKNWFGLDLLWKLAIGGNRKAFECLSELFKQDCFESIRKTYLLNCIDMLKSRHNTSGTVSLMKTLLATYSLQKRKKKQSTWGVIASINEKTNLMDHFFTNFEIQFPSDMENTTQTDQELRDQLDFLEFVIRNSPITLSVKNCIILWTHGNKDIVMEWMAKMRENYCEDFTSFDDETTRFVFEELICSLSKAESLYSNISENYFNCFRTFFKAVNINSKRLEIIYETVGENENTIIIEQPNSGKKFISKIITKGKELLEPPVPSQEMEEDPIPIVKKIKKIDVLSDDLIGLSHFWNLILSVKDQKVLGHAIEYMNNYKTGYAKELKHFIADYREKFISKCMELLKQYSSTSKRKDTYICNIISLMIDYIIVANQKSGGGGYKGHGISFLGYPITLKISCYTNESFMKSVSSKMKIYELTNLIATELGDESSAHLLRLENDKGEDLSCFKHKTLEDIGLESTAEIYVRPISSRDITFSLTSGALKALGVPELANAFLSRNRSSTKKVKKQEGGFLSSASQQDDSLDEEYVILNLEDGLNPASILSKESHFSLLFSLLDGSSSDEVAKKVWMLLMHLPTNYAMSKNILNIENMQSNINWMEILPTNSTHKLLYCLQILDSKFSKNFIPGSKMYDNFVKYGGLKHLVDGLLCIGKSYKNPLQKQCAALLLKILNKFIPENNERLNEILLNLLETLRVLIAEEKENVSNSNTLSDSAAHRPSTSFQYNPQFTTTSEYAHFMLYDYALTTIRKITSSKPDLLQLLLTHETTLSTTKSLLFSQDVNIRKKFANTVLELSSSSSQASTYFITTLYNIMMTDDIDMYKDRCDDYFLLLENSIMNSKHFTEISQEEVFTIVKKIFDRPIIEENNTSTADQVLIGYFNVAKALIRTYPFLKQELHKHIKDLFLNGLFEVPKLTDKTDNLPLPKCKTKESREAAFNFLQEVVDSCPGNYLEILQLLEEYIRGCEQPQNWQVYPIYQEKKKPYVGLKNQGATCYMNSLLQQFFMTIPFRKELITVNTDELPANEKLKENVTLLREVQNMFAFLEYGRKKFYDTRPFCRVYKVDGRPVECSTQHDANEFFNLFMDCVEEALKFYKKDYLLRDVYGGSLLHQIIYEENISERPENFNIISLEVKNKRNIMESLELYCQGEMLEGNNQYFSDKLDRHVDALKRTLIKDLPNVLILHLKRFDFDFSLMVNRKINDRVEFPHLLNMEPYTVEGMERKENRGIYDITPPHRPDDYYQYKLVGVLVHSGSADSGHYYSFIMDRKNNEEEKWYEFNDEEINPFDLNRMEMECFGGLVEHNISGKKTSLFRCNNAYMLFYQRVSVLNAESFETKETSAIQPASSVMTQVWKENEKFYHYKNIFDESFDSYLFGNLSTYQNNDYDMLLRNVQLACNYIFGYYIRSYNPKVVKWITYFKDTFEKNSRIAKWFLVEFARTDKWKIDSLLICPSQEIRDSIVDLIIATLRSLYPVENVFEYFEKEEWRFTTTKTITNYSTYDEPIEVTEKDYECSSGFFIDCMIDMLSVVSQFHKSTAHYFRLLEDIVSLGPISYRLLCVKRQLISKLALILGGLIPKHQNEGDPTNFNFNPKYSLVSTFGQLSVAFIIRIFSILVRTCSSSSAARPPTIMDTDQEDSITGVIVSSGPLVNSNPRSEPYAFTLSSSDREKLFHRAFFNYLVSMNIRLQDIAAMLTHWCWENIVISKKFCELFIQSIIINSGSESSDSFFLVFDSLLSIEDSIQSERVGHCLDHYFDGLSRMIDNKSLLYCMKHLARIDKMNEHTKSWWDNNFKAIETITSKKGWTIERKQ